MRPLLRRRSPPLPVDAVVAVTYLCNSRCTMCDFWKETRPPTLTIDDYRKLPPTLRTINVSGGEPFLHPQLVAIIQALHETCPKARITISTNGFLTDRIVARMEEILRVDPEIGVRISVDGVGDMHEHIRRIPQAYAKCMATLRALRALGVRDLGLAYTMTNENIDHLTQVYGAARSEDVQFTCAFMHTSEFYFGGKENRVPVSRADVARAFDTLIARELASWEVKRWARAFFTWGLKRLACDGVQVLPSRAGVDYCFLDPFGNVLPSVMHPNLMGNLTQHATFVELWSSDTAVAARRAVAQSEQPYWLMCTARTAMQRHPIAVISWIARQKLGTMVRDVRHARNDAPRSIRTHHAQQENVARW